MTKFFVDGFVMGANPSQIGGGFTIVDENNKFISRKMMKKVGFTNNDGEILGIYFALKHCGVGDTISSDSQTAIGWVMRAYSKSRKDLNTLLRACQIMMSEKEVSIIWEGRDDNLAGVFNEDNGKKYKLLRLANEKGIDSDFAEFAEHIA